MYIAISTFVDKNGTYYRAGDEVKTDSPEVLIAGKVIRETSTREPREKAVALGGGWYQLPNGAKVQGKKNIREG